MGSKDDARETKKESGVSKLQLLIVQTGTEQQLCVTVHFDGYNFKEPHDVRENTLTTSHAQQTHTTHMPSVMMMGATLDMSNWRPRNLVTMPKTP